MDDEVNESVRPLLIQIVDYLIDRPLSMTLRVDGKENPFLFLKNYLLSEKSITMTEFETSIDSVFTKAEEKENEIMTKSAAILRKKFEKKFYDVVELKNYRLRDYLVRHAKKVFPGFQLEKKKTDTAETKGKKMDTPSPSDPQITKEDNKSISESDDKSDRNESADTDEEYVDEINNKDISNKSGDMDIKQRFDCSSDFESNSKNDNE